MAKKQPEPPKALEALVEALHAAMSFEVSIREVGTCWRRYGRPRRDVWPARWRAMWPGSDRRVGVTTRLFVHENQDEASAPVVPTEWAEVLDFWSEAFPGWRTAIERALASLRGNTTRHCLGDDLLREVGAGLVRIREAFERLGTDGAAVAWSEGLVTLPEDWNDGVVSVLRRACNVLRAAETVGDVPRVAGGGRATLKRRRVRGLTRIETMVFEAVGRCNGNYPTAARMLGMTRQSVRGAYLRAQEKVGTMSAGSIKAARLAREPSGDARLTRG